MSWMDPVDHISFWSSEMKKVRTHFLAFSNLEIEFEVSHQEPSSREDPFGTLVILAHVSSWYILTQDCINSHSIPLRLLDRSCRSSCHNRLDTVNHSGRASSYPMGLEGRRRLVGASPWLEME